MKNKINITFLEFEIQPLIDGLSLYKKQLIKQKRSNVTDLIKYIKEEANKKSIKEWK